MRRIYQNVLASHLAEHRQMAFLSGPRQVGKTTLCRELGDVYFSWDVPEHSRLIVEGVGPIAQAAGLDQLTEKPPVVIFDELHKYARWKSFLKGFFDLQEKRCRLVVTGSSRLDIYRRGGDSLMGRYLPYRMHPLSVAELLTAKLPATQLMRKPKRLDAAQWENLLRMGGFPEPFLKGSETFARRWRSLRRQQLIREDARDLTRVQELSLLDVTARLLEDRSGEQLVYENLARDVGVSPHTIKAWISILESLHLGFRIRPWSRNLTSALRKEPKWFLRDWSGISDDGQRFETLVACHLLKAVEGWNDLGLGDFELRYVRDKQKREVDFLVVRDGRPWILAEAKVSETRLSPALLQYRSLLGVPHAFQIVQELDFVGADPFAADRPLVVPARTFLSQLL